MEADHRPFVTESEGSEDVLQDGDSPVCSSFGSKRGLDGVSRLEGCVLADSDSSGKSQVPQIRGFREGVPVQGSLLWAIHGSAGLHSGHGSGFVVSSPVWYSPSSVPRRLANSGVLSGAGSPSSGYGSPALSSSRNCRQLGEVSVGSYPADGLSRCPSGLSLFQGFAYPKESREASLNWRRILVLRRAVSVILARALRNSVFHDSARSLGSPSDAFSSADPAAFLGSLRPVTCRQVDSSSSSGSGVVAGSLSSQGGRIPRPGVPPPARLVVRHLGRGFGAHLGEDVTSGLWFPQEAILSINARELLAVKYGLWFFAPQIMNSTVALFADNSTAIAYLRNQGGTRSKLLNSIAQRILRWAESIPVMLAPQFIMGWNNVLADSLSRPNQILGSEWTLKTEVVQDLRRRWPVSIDLFATSLNHQCCPYFSPFHDLNALGTDALLQTGMSGGRMPFLPGL